MLLLLLLRDVGARWGHARNLSIDSSDSISVCLAAFTVAQSNSSTLFFLITIRFQSVFGKHVKLYTPGANEAVAKNKEKARVSIAVWLGEEKSQQVSECRLFLFSPSFFFARIFDRDPERS